MHMEPARLVWLYAESDAALARELGRLFAVLERQGEIQSFSPRHIPAGQEIASVMAQQVERADILLLLLSADFLSSEERWIELALDQQRRGARVIPVLLRPAVLPASLERLMPLPRDGKAITTWPDRDEAFLAVVEGVRTLLSYRHRPEAKEANRRWAPQEPAAPAMLLDRAVEKSAEIASPPLPEARPIDRIFRRSGTPDVTFVEPAQFTTLQVELDAMGTGLVIEGPSKVGKTTAVKKALAQQERPRPVRWLDGKMPPGAAELREIFDALVSGELTGHLLIDDFHYLDDELRRQLAFRMKALADQDEPKAKVTVIGVNPVGSSLTRALPDLAGRFRMVRMDRQTVVKVAELVIKGEHAANVRFRRRDEIISEADGSFFIAQLLCYQAAVASGVRSAQPAMVDIALGPADVLEAIQEELRARYHDDLRDFAAYDESPPPRGACLALLWLLSQSKNGEVTLQEAIYRFPGLTRALDWLRSGNLLRCFDERPRLKALLYYHNSAATLSLEDPELRFYLRKLDWAELARASGHVSVRFHPIDGPLFAPPSSVPPSLPRGVRSPPAASTAADGSDAAGPADEPRSPGVQILHLSDLHFGTEDQATLWYAQLAADLRQQGCERLDAMVVSGDIANLSIPEEYTAARIFLEHVMGGFGLSPRQLVLVPGNHDLNWPLSQDAYALHKRARYRGVLREGEYIAHGADIIEVRDPEAYRERFRHFAELYRQVRGEEYPLDYDQQGIVQVLPDQGLLFLGLNSAWEIDHHHRDRASIHTGAFARALLRIGELPSTDRLRIAVWHHPVSGPESDRIRDAGFLQQLAVAGFRVALHGHVHRADDQLYRYDKSRGGRRLEVVSAGTFGAPVHAWVPGYPLQYNLLRLAGETLTVETRCREELNGAWRPDARWLQGPGENPLPRYEISLG